jgi:hypothetical protein
MLPLLEIDERRKPEVLAIWRANFSDSKRIARKAILWRQVESSSPDRVGRRPGAIASCVNRERRSGIERRRRKPCHGSHRRGFCARSTTSALAIMPRGSIARPTAAAATKGNAGRDDCVDGVRCVLITILASLYGAAATTAQGCLIF